jgi:methylated-DNA-[protein]-cysteine S-methyltransferase
MRSSRASGPDLLPNRRCISAVAIDKERMAERPRYHLFETAAGFVALGWNDRGIAALRLPDASAHDAERALLRRLPNAERSEPPLPVQTVVDAIVRYFVGERIDFSAIPVDMGAQEPFFERVYTLVRGLGWGETTTYGAVARTLGAGLEFARDVGQAMASNPVPLIVPCHRVTGAGGKIGGFSAPGGSMSKARMLELEGVAVDVPAPKKMASKSKAQTAFDF